MTIADDLSRLEQMHARGSLNDSEFHAAKQRLLDATSNSPSAPIVNSLNGFRRSTRDRWIGGVCGGLAVSTGIEAWLWRVALLCLTMLGGVGLIAYAIVWLFAPMDRQTPLLPSN
jgi:phage shock protein C